MIAHEASLTASRVTMSIGVACYDDDSACWVPPSADNRYGPDLGTRCSQLAILQAADSAMYLAKHAGRAPGEAVGCRRLRRAADGTGR